jgi:Cu(I)/Ag(I) efflux system membrane fusion protein
MREISLFMVKTGALILLASMGFALFVVCTKKIDTQAVQTQTTVYHCPMHPTYLAHKPGNCPICGMKLVPANAHTDNQSGVRIDPAMIQSIGVQTEKAAVRLLIRDIRTSATIMPDERRVSTITTKVMGYIEKLHVDYTGRRVKKGEPLYELYSPELMSAQSEYLQAYQSAATADSGWLRHGARQRLLNWDITEQQIAELEKRGTPVKTMTVVSPVAGIVTEKMVVVGQAIEPGMQLYKIVDYSHVWIEAAVYQQDISLVKVGLRGIVELDNYPGERFSATLTYIAPLMVRLEVANTPDLKIKPGMNATVTLEAALKKSAITVPEQAVIRSGQRTLIVIAKGGGYFEPREIRVGESADGYIAVIDGITEGEEIVVSSQFLIDSESNLKAAVSQLSGKRAEAAPEGSRSSKADSTVKAADNAHPAKKPGSSTHPPKGAPQLYTCPMHPEVIREKQGICPICEMALVPKNPPDEVK